MNKIRVPFIVDTILAYGLHGNPGEQQARRSMRFPLADVNVLDVGCGGGILSEPLARLGGQITGIDMVEESINVARYHWKTSELQADNRTGGIEYLHGTVEELAHDRPETFDVVVCSEVVEHVTNDVGGFVETIALLTRPGGVAVFSTINRTAMAFLQAILGAEYLLRIVPHGTHHYGKFVTPEELSSYLRRCGFDVRLKHGALYNPITQRWTWSAFDGVNYFLAAVKSDQPAA